MIGFSKNLYPESATKAEDHDTKNLDKKELYDMISHKYVLPPYSSRGVDRIYLLGVHRGELFKVSLGELKHFEVDLTPEMTKRVGVLNCALLVQKLNDFLKSKRSPELGFTIEDPPEQVRFSDQVWLYRMARYIDPTNLLEFFESPVRPEPACGPVSSQISLIYHGRVKACQYFFRIEEAKSHKKLWESLRVLSDTYRQYQTQHLTLKVFRKQLEDLEKKVGDMGNTLDHLISQSAFIYTTIENPLIRPEMIINNTPEITTEIRSKISTNQKL